MWRFGSLSLLLLLACGPTQEQIAEREKKAEFHYNLAYGYFFKQSGFADAALQEAFQSQRLNPDNPNTHLLLGLIFLGREHHSKALHHFKRADALKQNFYSAKNNIGATYLAMKRWDQAIKIYGVLIQDMHYNTPAHGHNNLGWAYYQKKNFRKARRHFLTAIQLSPIFCPAYNNLGMVYLEEGKGQQAEKYLRRGIKRCPSYAEPHYHLGRSLARRSAFSEAQTEFNRCLTLAGESLLAERCEKRLSTLKPLLESSLRAQP